ncbi:MAG: hypothetical protein ACREQ5_22460, partial [Candidatus Dormibacteria bacterium]
AQPDDFTFALVTLVVLLLDVLRDRRLAARAAFATALAIAVLAFVKEHYAIILWLCALAPVAFDLRRLRARASTRFALAAMLALPPAALLLAFWLTPTRNLSGALSLAGGGLGYDRLGALATGASLGLHALADAFAGGHAFRTFWLQVTVRGATIVPAHAVPAASALICLAMAVVTGVVLTVQLGRWKRIAAIARRRSALSALRLIARDVPLNLYVTWTAFLVLAFIATRGIVYLQGRYWLPVLVPLVVVVLERLRSAVPRRARERLSVSLSALAACGSLAATPLALAAMQKDFYFAPPVVPTSDRFADLEHAVADGRYSVDLGTTFRLQHPGTVRLSGFAIDERTGYPARRVVAELDGKALPVRTGIARPDVLKYIIDDAILHCGVSMTIPAADLGPGAHHLSLAIDDPAAGPKLPFSRHFTIVVGAPAVARR